MTAIDEVCHQLAGIESGGTFATRRTGPAENLDLRVEGVGRIRLPISRADARRLAAIARPARYGLKTRTRLDPRVRDTGEIPRRLITIDESRWTTTLRPMLDQLRRDLGLLEGIELVAALHNVLVYEPGQFFTVHQDSEKARGMVGTLVVILPSAFTGGALVIAHHDRRVTYRGSGRQLTFVAFYADCHHEVRPVTSGHRIVLTYDLIAKGRPSRETTVSEDRVQALARSIQTYFEVDRPQRWSQDTRRERPDRLVYLLDHQYTRQSLGWQRLKNADAMRAAALRTVAQRLDCEITLALADVHESWSCEDEHEAFSRGRGRRSYWDDNVEMDEEDEDIEDADASAPVDLIELLESEVELRHWIGPRGRVEGMSGAVDRDEVCFTRASNELEPFASEHEGYMGNYGNTVDHWYHRAAVVLWPRARTFVIRAKATPRWAIDEIQQAIHRREIERARSLAHQLTPFWSKVAPRDESRIFLERTLQTAAGLDSPELARALLLPFALERLTPRAVTKLVVCGECYGVRWCQTILEAWTSQTHGEPARRVAWTAALPAVCRAACADRSSEGLQLARYLVANRWEAFVKQWSAMRDVTRPRSVVDAARELSRPILGLLDSCLVAQHPELHAEMLRTMVAPQTRYPIKGLVAMLRMAHDEGPRDHLQRLGLSMLYARCVESLGAWLRQPVRGADDWSVRVSFPCTCRLCGVLGEFLRDPSRQGFEWPLAKDHRAHVHQAIDSHDLPVNHVTRRIGRPFVLVLTKTSELLRRETAERAGWKRDLQWLTDVAPAFQAADGD